MPEVSNREYTKYMHVERMGHGDVEGLTDGEVVVQEKLDGANLNVAWDAQLKDFVIASRHKVIYANGVVVNEFRGAVDYVRGISDLEEVMIAHPTWILRGEWLIKHSVNYDTKHIHKFYVFDVQDRADDNRYLHPDEYAALLNDWGVRMVPEVARLNDPTIADLTPLSTEKSLLDPATDREGIVIKRYGYKNTWGQVVWGKIVSEDFKEKARSPHANKYDPSELAFAALVTKSFVMKEICKVQDHLDGPVSVKNMREILGRVWSEAFHELLWSFVKKKNIKNFSFIEARRLVYLQAREVAITYFNGILDKEEDNDNGKATDDFELIDGRHLNNGKAVTRPGVPQAEDTSREDADATNESS